MGEHPRADRARRIIDILGFTPDPYRTPEEMLSRANLLTELHRHNILKEVPKEIAAIFKCLEQVASSSHHPAAQNIAASVFGSVTTQCPGSQVGVAVTRGQRLAFRERAP